LLEQLGLGPFTSIDHLRNKCPRIERVLFGEGSGLSIGVRLRPRLLSEWGSIGGVPVFLIHRKGSVECRSKRQIIPSRLPNRLAREQ
jgi:hypothetical protein